MLRIILVLAACSFGQEATAKRVVMASGEKGYSIRCDNMPMNACLEKAGEICHRGYDVQAENKESGFESGGSAFVGSAFGTASSASRTTSEKGLIIQCKNPEVTEYERSIRHKERLKAQKEADDRAAKSLLFGFAGVVTFLAIIFVMSL